MSTVDAVSVIVMTYTAILSLYCLLKVYFLKKYDDKEQRDMVKRISWIIFLLCSISLIGHFWGFF